MDEDNKSRFLLDRCRDPIARDTYLALYKRVYGEKPDNDYISISLLRGAYMFYGCNKDVNWVGHASKVYTKRFEHPAKNPLKLLWEPTFPRKYGNTKIRIRISYSVFYPISIRINWFIKVN